MAFLIVFHQESESGAWLTSTKRSSALAPVAGPALLPPPVLPPLLSFFLPQPPAPAATSAISTTVRTIERVYFTISASPRSEGFKKTVLLDGGSHSKIKSDRRSRAAVRGAGRGSPRLQTGSMLDTAVELAILDLQPGAVR